MPASVQSSGTFGDYLLHTFGSVTLETILNEANNMAVISQHPASCRVLAAAVRITGCTSDDLAFGCGLHFVKSVSAQGYGMLFSLMGRTFLEFLGSLNKLNSYLSVGMPDLILPDLTVQKFSSTSVELHCKSLGPGVGPLLEGIIAVVAENCYCVCVSIQMLRGPEDGSCEHTVYSVTFPADESWEHSEEELAEQELACEVGLDPATFYKLFPYHFVVDEQCRIVQLGSSLQRLHPDMKIGSNVSAFFQIQAPLADWKYDQLCEYERASILLQSTTGLELKGQLVQTAISHRAAAAAAAAAESAEPVQAYSCVYPNSKSVGSSNFSTPLGSLSPEMLDVHSLSLPVIEGLPLRASEPEPEPEPMHPTPELQSLPLAAGVGQNTMELGFPLSLSSPIAQHTPYASCSQISDFGPLEHLPPSEHLPLNDDELWRSWNDGELMFVGSLADRQVKSSPNLCLGGPCSLHGMRLLDGPSSKPSRLGLGRMLPPPVARARGLMFLGAPRIKGLDELQAHGIFLSEIPLHDLSGDFVMLMEQQRLMEMEEMVLQQQCAQLKVEQMVVQQECSELRMQQVAVEDQCAAIQALGRMPRGSSGHHDRFNDMASEMALRMVEQVISGSQVTVADALQLRGAITKSGTDMRKLHNLQDMLNSRGDDDVSMALMKLLVDDEREELDDDDNGLLLVRTASHESLSGSFNPSFEGRPGLIPSRTLHPDPDTHPLVSPPSPLLLPPSSSSSKPEELFYMPPDRHPTPVSSHRYSHSQQVSTLGAVSAEMKTTEYVPSPVHSRFATSHMASSATGAVLGLSCNSAELGSVSMPRATRPAGGQTSSHEIDVRWGQWGLRRSQDAPSKSVMLPQPTNTPLSSINPRPLVMRLVSSLAVGSDAMRPAAKRCGGQPAVLRSASFTTVGRLASSSLDRIPESTLLVPSTSCSSIMQLSQRFTTAAHSGSSSRVPPHDSGIAATHSLNGDSNTTQFHHSLPLHGAGHHSDTTLLPFHQELQSSFSPVLFPGLEVQPGGTTSLWTNTKWALKLLRSPSDNVNTVLAKIADWQFDTFELSDVSGGKPLSMLAFALFKQAGMLPGRIGISESRLASFLCRIEDGYLDHPYHSKVHGADVLRTMHVTLTRGDVLRAVVPVSGAGVSIGAGAGAGAGSDAGAVAGAGSGAGAGAGAGAFAGDSGSLLKGSAAQCGVSRECTLLSCYLAAILHDYEHKGVNNDFLIRSNDPISLTYNDKSPMENHSVAAAFRLLQEDRFNFLCGASNKVRELVRKQVIEMVLATDMKQHFFMQSQLNAIVDSCMAGVPEGSEVSEHVPAYDAMDDNARLLMMQMLIKCSDIGHLAHATAVHLKWVAQLEEELFRQGDRERSIGLAVSPLMDRCKEGVSKSQSVFISIVALPMFKSFVALFPRSKPMLDAVQKRYNICVMEAGSSARPSPAQPSPVRGQVLSGARPSPSVCHVLPGARCRQP